MMHGHGNSDSVIVATNPANKADGAVAESAERRTGTKGKAIASTTRRVQDRESVSPGLDRLRQRANGNRNETFTSLLHHISADLLSKAYHWIKHDAAAGVDGVTWRVYGIDLQVKLADLHDRIH